MARSIPFLNLLIIFNANCTLFVGMFIMGTPALASIFLVHDKKL